MSDNVERRGKKPIRVLVMDGGPSVTTYIYNLQSIVDKYPDFLSKVDVIVGNSDGAFLAMYLASRPPEAFDRRHAKATAASLLDFCKGVFYNCEPILPGLGYLRLFSGLLSYTSEVRLQAYLEACYGPWRTLKDLPSGRRVVMPTYKMTGEPEAVIQANFGSHAVWDVSPARAAMQSGSFPVLFSLDYGHVDGGAFANNPSMTGLAQLCAVDDPASVKLEDVVMFSIGADSPGWGPWANWSLNQRQVSQWGLVQWFLGCFQPLLLGAVLLDAQQRGSSLHVKKLIGDRFLRLSVPIGEGIVWGLTEYVLRLAKLMFAQGKLANERWVNGEHNACQPSFEQTGEWLQKYWFNDP